MIPTPSPMQRDGVRPNSFLTLLIACLMLSLLAGCGSHSGSSSSQGRATLTLLWPTTQAPVDKSAPASRLIPAVTKSVKVQIHNGTTLLATQTLQRPAGGGPVTITFNGLPPAALTATATAYPTTDATGNSVATAAVPLQILDGQTTPFSITMQSTIHHLSLSPPSPAVQVGNTQGMTATALDIANNVVLIQPSNLVWSTTNPGVASIDQAGILRGVAAGTVQIGVQEKESTKSVTTTATVTSVQQGGNGTANVKLDIHWPQRSRAVGSLSSALSLKLTMRTANPDGSDFVFVVNRGTNLADFVSHSVSPTPAKVGLWIMNLRGYSQPDATGTLVGIADVQAPFQADGTGVPDIDLAGVIKSVTTPLSQCVPLGSPKDLLFKPLDAQGNLVLVTPGSAVWTIVSGSENLQLVNGQAVGQAVGVAQCKVTIDGRVSGTAPVAISDGSTPCYQVDDLGVGEVIKFNRNGQVLAQDTTGTFILNIATGQKSYLAYPPGFNFIQAEDMNDAGTVVGSSEDRSHVNLDGGLFLWRNGIPTPISLTLPGDTGSSVTGINNHDEIIGNSILKDQGGAFVSSHPALYKNGVLTALPIYQNDDNTIPFHINDKGEICGKSGPFSFPARDIATLWKDGTVSKLGTLPDRDQSYATWINENGFIIGGAIQDNLPSKAFYIPKAGTDPIEIQGVGRNYPSAMNDKGIILINYINGAHTPPGAGNPFIFFKDKGRYDGNVYAVNNIVPLPPLWRFGRLVNVDETGRIASTGLIYKNPNDPQDKGTAHILLLTPQ